MRGPAGGAAPAHGRRREPQGGHQQPGAVAAGGARGAAEVVRGAEAGVHGPRLAGLAHKIFLKAKRGPRGAGEAGLCGQRADFAGAVRRLPQREEGERAAHQPGVLLWQQGAQLLNNGVQLVLVAQPPAAEKLHGHPHGALMSRSFCELTQVLICMCRPLMKRVSRAP